MHISYGNMWGSPSSVHVWMVATRGDGHVLVPHARARGCVVRRVTEHESQCMYTQPLCLARAALPPQPLPSLLPAARNYFLAAGSLRQHVGAVAERRGLGNGVERRRR